MVLAINKRLGGVHKSGRHKENLFALVMAVLHNGIAVPLFHFAYLPLFKLSAVWLGFLVLQRAAQPLKLLDI